MESHSSANAAAIDPSGVLFEDHARTMANSIVASRRYEMEDWDIG